MNELGIEIADRPIVLMTTTDFQSNRADDIRRLIKSLAAVRLARPSLIIEHHMLLQRCRDVAAARAHLGLPEDMIVTASVDQLPLSIARNRMLDQVLAGDRPELDNALIAFPDDDAWFAPGTLEYIWGRFLVDPDIDLWFCRYGAAPDVPDTITQYRASLAKTIARASSNTIFLRGSLLRRIGGFDESLGLGTPAKSGEDTEFAMRAYFAARNTWHAPHVLMGHRDFNPAIRAKYYAGTLVALGRYAGYSLGSGVAFARKILVGATLVAKRELPISDFLGAWKMYARNRRAPNLIAGRASDVQLPNLARGKK